MFICQSLRACACVLSSCIPYTAAFRIPITFLSGTGTHLSKQRRCSSAQDRRAAHVPKLWYKHFVSYAFASQQAEKRHCRRGPCDHLICIQLLSRQLDCKKSASVRQLVGMSRMPGRRVFLYFFASGPTFSMSCPSHKRLALEVQRVPFSVQRLFRGP